jgi:peptidoglycan-associated lipoprotein
MKRNNILTLGMILLLTTFALWGCPKKSEVTATPELPQTGTSPETSPNSQVKTVDTSGAKTEGSEGSNERSATASAGLQPVLFDYDKSIIRDDAKPVMTANAQWLKANPNVTITIEGNCDERGTREYNQALGQRRAAIARKYLADMGVSANRISLISYGKEKPVCTDDSEECWRKNRRDDFVAIKK